MTIDDDEGDVWIDDPWYEDRDKDDGFCTGPYCVPKYETVNGKDKQTGVVCPLDCSLCGINGDSTS